MKLSAQTIRLWIFAVCLIVLAFVGRLDFACTAPAAWPEAVYSHGAVAADQPVASQIGVEILRDGGNVVDAAAEIGAGSVVVSETPRSAGMKSMKPQTSSGSPEQLPTRRWTIWTPRLP